MYKINWDVTIGSKAGGNSPLEVESAQHLTIDAAYEDGLEGFFLPATAGVNMVRN